MWVICPQITQECHIGKGDDTNPSNVEKIISRGIQLFSKITVLGMSDESSLSIRMVLVARLKQAARILEGIVMDAAVSLPASS
jgi:hypothetical protein